MLSLAFEEYTTQCVNSETKNTTSKNKNKSSISDVPNISHSQSAITGAECYQKISVTEDVFHSIMIQSNLELLPSCERQAYGEMVCICSSVNQSQVPKWLLLFYSQLRLTKDWYLFWCREAFQEMCVCTCVCVFLCMHFCYSIHECVRASQSVCFWLCGTLWEMRIQVCFQVFMCRSNGAF